MEILRGALRIFRPQKDQVPGYLNTLNTTLANHAKEDIIKPMYVRLRGVLLTHSLHLPPYVRREQDGSIVVAQTPVTPILAITSKGDILENGHPLNGRSYVNATTKLLADAERFFPKEKSNS